MLSLSQRPAVHHGQAYRPDPPSGALPGHSFHYNAHASPNSRLRSLSFQGATTPATGKQPPSKEPLGAAKLTPGSSTPNGGKEDIFIRDRSQASGHGKQLSQSQNAGTTATAAGEDQQQQQQERLQASGGAPTSGREYWQVRPFFARFVINLAHPCSFRFMPGFLQHHLPLQALYMLHQATACAQCARK